MSETLSAARQKTVVDNFPYSLIRALPSPPFIFQQLPLEKVLQTVFQDALTEGEFDFLVGHHIQITIHDIGLSWNISCQNQKLVVSQYANPSASICGNLKEFIQLACRCEDPDTLFFQRRLIIEGDTEIGLQFKNMLDTIDLDNLPAPLKAGLRLISRFAC